MSLIIFDPDQGSTTSAHRGGGRVLKMLRDNIGANAIFTANVKDVSKDDTLFLPFWHPYRPAVIKKRYAHRQILSIYDVIPFKYPDKFPLGFRSKLSLIENLNALQHFDEFITITEASKKDIVQHLNIDPEKVHVVHLTTDALFFEKKIKSDGKRKTQPDIPHGPFCVYVGDVNWNKNIVNIARAIKIAQVKCVFIGKAFTDEYSDLDHPERAELKMFKKEVAGNDNFIFPGYIADADIIEYYKNAVCNILVSRDEGFGLSYLEASSQKCPSVLSDIGVFNETADDTALFAQPEDPQSIAEKVVRLIQDKEFRSELGAKAYKRSKRFAPDKFAQRMLAVLDKK